MSRELIAYHGNQYEKEAILTQLRAHRLADEIIKDKFYWYGGKGCAVGCTIHSDDHMEYEQKFGIPVMLARFEDAIFEGLPNELAQGWPERFMSAIQPGSDLSRVGWKLLHWLLTDADMNPGIRHPLVAGAVKSCTDVVVPLCHGGLADVDAAEIAQGAAWTAERDAAHSMEWSAEESAACAALSAASVEESTASAAESAASAARAVLSAAESAAIAESAKSAESEENAMNAAWLKIADKLIELVSQSSIGV